MTEPEQSELEPEAPDLGASVQLDAGETLDGAPGTDGLDAGYVAPNKPFFLDDPDTTPEGQRTGDTLDERLRREIPDDAEGAASGPRPDQTAGEIGPEAGQGRSGRLTSDDGLGGPSLDGMEASDVGVSGGAASAEEAAVHDIDEDEITDLGEAEAAPVGEPVEAPEGPEVRLRDVDVDPTAGGPGDPG